MEHIHSATLEGLDCTIVTIDADIAAGLPGFTVVGLPDTAVKESRERIRAAIKNSGFSFPRTRVTVNLAPADLKKGGSHHDLAVAIALLRVSGVVNLETHVDESLFIGELGLDGTIRPVDGVLAMVRGATQTNLKTVFVAEGNATEATLIEGTTVFGVQTLVDLVEHLNGTRLLSQTTEKIEIHAFVEITDVDLAHVRGQLFAKRALEVAAAGGHNILMSGPPGAGKTLLARGLATILPAPTRAESIEITTIWSAAGMLAPGSGILSARPFRSPHHSASVPSLVGGGAFPRPGEVTLAHHGVLFLDEFPEFPRHVLESLRQPLEDGLITVARAAGSSTFPARFMLVAAQNPCPCGAWGSNQECTCTARELTNYSRRISGPLLDRIDIRITVPAVAIDELRRAGGESSSVIRARVEAARALQRARLEGTGAYANAAMSAELARTSAGLSPEATTLLEAAVESRNLSARAYHRILRVARTIADLDNTEHVAIEHLAEALQYSPAGTPSAR